MMRKLLFLLPFIITACQTFSQQWYEAVTPRPRHINSVAIPKPGTLAVAGGHEFNDSIEAFFYSDNGGLAWQLEDSLGSWIKSIALLDSVNGIAAGFSGKIMKTADGGRTWLQVSSPVNDRHFHKVFIIDSMNMFIAGGLRVSNHFQTVLKSSDGGSTWSVIYDEPGFWLKSLFFKDALNGIAVGDSATILMTTDGGGSWTPVASPVQKRNFNAVTFINDSVGYIVGGNLTDTIRTLLRTNDGGMSWTLLTDEPGGWLTDIYFLDGNTGYICGYDAALLKTTDSGQTWTPETVNNATGAEAFNTVRFYDENYGVLGARDGVVFVYTQSSSPAAVTIGADVTSLTEATLNGTVNSHGEPAMYSFTFSTSSSFNGFQSTFPQRVTSSTPAQVWTNLHSLAPNTTYYFYIKTWTLAGESYGNVMTFFTGPPFLEFKTAGVSYTDSSATLLGLVNNFPDLPVDLFFEYGTSPSLGNEIRATPATIADAGLYDSITAYIDSLNIFTKYYFRLKGVSANRSYYGNLISVFTGKVFSAFQTLPVSNITDSSVTLNGFIDDFQFPANLSFEYGIAPSVNLSVTANPSSINDTLPHHISATITNLQPLTDYYVKLKGVTSLETFHGATLYFNSTLYYSDFKTMPATDITPMSATFNGFIAGLNKQASLVFEYGTDSSFGNIIAASPGTINDTLEHFPSANISGFQPNTIYYYRIKATTGGYDFYGDTRQLYVGSPNIPNWDFQFWREDTFLLPDQWNLIGDDYERVPGQTGYALKVANTTLAILGVFYESDDNTVFAGGQPFQSRPDSISAYLNYAFAPGDSGIFLVHLYTSDYEIVFSNFFFLTGNTGGVFQRLTFPLSYSSGLTPDSIILGFLPRVPDRLGNPSNYIIIDDITGIPVSPEIYNADFEVWIDYPHNSLLDWTYQNHIEADTTDLNKPGMVTRTFFNAPDDYAAEVRNLPVPGGWLGGELSNSNSLFNEEEGGFPVSARHKTLNGYFMWNPANGDTMEITIEMLLHGQVIANGNLVKTEPAMQFTTFDIPINYLIGDESAVPDSAIIFINSYKNQPRGPSVLTIDKLSFDGFSLPAIPDTVDMIPNLSEFAIAVYPNPSREMIVVETARGASQKIFLELIDLNGKKRKEIIGTGGQNKFIIETSGLDSGFYLLKIKSGNVLTARKVIIAK